MIKFFLISALLLTAAQGFCQPSEFYSGLDQLRKYNFNEAKKDFILSAQKAPDFNGSYYFLGTICFNENKLDSAIMYFKKSIELNKENNKGTKEMAYNCLASIYVYQKDFKNAFEVTWDGLQQYPESDYIKGAMGNLCLWAFYINDDGLDPAYCSPNKQDVYVVNSIAEEYAIYQGIQYHGEHLDIQSKPFMKDESGAYDVFKCKIHDSETEVDLKFKINWDVNDYPGGKMVSTQSVIRNARKPVYERVGAMLLTDRNTDLKAAIESLQK